MSNELFDAIKSLEAQNGISSDILIEKIKQGILKAVKRDYPDTENVRIEMDPEKGVFEMCLLKTVVDEVLDPANEISIDEARNYSSNIALGDSCEIPLSPKTFGRVAASSAKQSIRSDLKQIERDRIVAQYQGKEHEIVSATVQKVEPVTGNAIITIDKDEVYFPRTEQIPGEHIKPGDIIKVYVLGVFNPDKKPTVRVSRIHHDFLRRLLELEVPEIYDGTVEIKGISREAGFRSKVAVATNRPDVDPIGACIGPKRSRIKAIVKEINGEKIDLIKYSDDPAEYVSAALSPAEVLKVEIDPEEPRNCTVSVPENQLSLAIGNKGQNAKLAARLTGLKIDIVSVPKEAEQSE